MTSIRYHEAAEDELLNEIAYLENHVPGLGRRFYAEIRRAEKLIAEFPESGRQLSPGIRARSLRAFPFSWSIRSNGTAC